MRILFVAAVDFELDVARMARTGTDDLFLCTGMGPEATARALRELPLRSGEFDLAVDLGVAGSYGGRLPAGSVVQVVIGEDDSEPVVGISDLLIHLAGEQMAKKASEVVGGEALDIIEIDIREAYDYLGEIIGETVSDEVLDEVFSRFCLGK